VVGQIDEEQLGYFVEEPDTPQAFGISLSVERDRQIDDLAPLAHRRAHRNRLRHKSTVVESRA